MQQREAAQKIALQALRDASATERVVRSLKYIAPFNSFLTTLCTFLLPIFLTDDVFCFVSGCSRIYANRLERILLRLVLNGFWNSIPKLCKQLVK